MTPVELVQDLYAAFGRGDIAHITARLTPDCVWVAPGQGIPSAGTYRGPEGALEFFRKLASSEDILRFEPREFFSSGNSVVALGFEQCRSKQTGKTAVTNWAMLFRIRDGKVSHFETHYDTAAYVAAHTQAAAGTTA